VRVSGGDLCAAEAPIEPAGETKDASKFGAQSEGRDLISGSLNYYLLIMFIASSKGSPSQITSGSSGSPDLLSSILLNRFVEI